jgi:hypothetical protein
VLGQPMRSLVVEDRSTEGVPRPDAIEAAGTQSAGPCWIRTASGAAVVTRLQRSRRVDRKLHVAAP